MTENPAFARIEADIQANDIVLYMKGSKKLPQCGFSATVAAIFERLGVSEYKDINVLADAEIREGVKAYAQWPTIPQLYIKGEFIGGCDIVRDMYQSGELQALLKENNIAFKDADAA
ncbi:MAG: Grx4 family monothiol glutaredoxin [Pseudomonadota bacterium]